MKRSDDIFVTVALMCYHSADVFLELWKDLKKMSGNRKKKSSKGIYYVLIIAVLAAIAVAVILLIMTLRGNGTNKDNKAASSSSSSSASKSESSAASSSEVSSASSSASFSFPEDPAQDKDYALDVVPQEAGSIYVYGDTGYERFYYTGKGCEGYAAMVNSVKAKLPATTDVYAIVVPNSTGIMLTENAQKKMGSDDQKKAIDYTYSLMDPSVKTVDTFDTLKNHNGEYLFFRTDHHWTQLGAYYAYRQFCKEKEIMPHDKSEYESHSYSGFVGSLYKYSGKVEALANNPDTVEVWVPLSTNECTYGSSTGKIVPSNASYGFIGGDQPMVTIDNPKLSDGTSCVLIKESYGNAFAPFLTDHYDKVYVVDYREYKDNLTEFVYNNNVNDVIFLNNDEFLLVQSADEMGSLFK